MKAVISYGFNFEEMEQIAEELNLNVSYDMGKVCFYDFNADHEDWKVTYTRVFEKIKEKYGIKEDLTNYDLYTQSCDQYWDMPVFLLPKYKFEFDR